MVCELPEDLPATSPVGPHSNQIGICGGGDSGESLCQPFRALVLEMQPSPVHKDKSLGGNGELRAGPRPHLGGVWNLNQTVLHQHRLAPSGDQAPGAIRFRLSAEVKSSRVPHKRTDRVQVGEFLQPVNESVAQQLPLRGKHVRNPRFFERQDWGLRHRDHAVKAMRLVQRGTIEIHL